MNAKEIINQYLEKMADADENFKARFEDKNKNIDECLDYVTSQARKEEVEGSACISDDVVFGWAVHYYQEKNLKIDKCTSKQNIDGVKITTSVPVKKRKVEHKEALELDLFGGLL